MDIILAVFGSVAGTLFLVWLIQSDKKRRQLKIRTEETQHAANYEARVTRRRRDSQLNHGGSIYNWLMNQLEEYTRDGLRMWVIADNGGKYSIQLEHETGDRPIPLLQISFDFMAHPEPYFGHIHYGAYGADILFWTGNQGTTNGLDRLVLKEVREFYEERRARTPAL